MTEKKSYSDYRRNWRAQTIDESFTETKLFIHRDDHEKVIQMAQFLDTRIPVLLGNLVSMGLGAMAGHEMDPLEAKPLPSLPEPDLCGKLCDLILYSRFPGDTGAARFRQVAFINCIFAANRRGEKVSATDLSKMVDSHYSQLEVLGRTMEQRGMIKREYAIGLGNGKPAKHLFIREDAVEAFDAAHKAAVGYSLL